MLDRYTYVSLFVGSYYKDFLEVFIPAEGFSDLEELLEGKYDLSPVTPYEPGGVFQHETFFGWEVQLPKSINGFLESVNPQIKSLSEKFEAAFGFQPIVSLGYDYC